MPFFDPNEDQNSATGGVTPMRAPSGVEPERRAAPTLGEGFAASMRLENPVYSLFRSMYRNEIFPPDPDFNPEKMEGYKGSVYEQNYSDRFVVTRSEAEARSIMQQIDEEQADRKTREASGGAGVLFDIFAGVVDPTIAMPGGAIYKSARGGYSVAKSMASVAAAGAAQMTVQETVLQNTQETRTALESTLNIASATILSGLLGAGAAAFLTRGESKALARALDADRRFIDAHYEGRPMPRPGDDVPSELRAKADELLAKVAKDNPDMTAEQIEAKAAEIWKNVSGERVRVGDAETTGQAQAAGAAVSDTRALERVKIVPDSVREIPGVAYVADKLGAIMDWRGPLSRLMGSQSAAARRATVDLAETPWRFEQNLEGVPTTNGPALERMAQLAIRQARVAVSDEMDRLFSEYRFQRPDVTMARARATFEDVTGRGEGFMTNAEFRKEVAKALSQGDQHAIPQVAEAAQFVRARVFEPWKKRAQAAGIFPENMGVTGAESYFMRMYNRKEIAARRPVFVDRVWNYLKRDQEVKAAAQERLQAMSDQLTTWQDKIGRLEARLETLAVREDRLLARLSEREMEVRRGEKRVGTLEERSGAIAEEITELEEFIAAMKQEVSDPALREQIEMVEREVAELRKQDRPMTEAQLRKIEDEELRGILMDEQTRLGAEMLVGRRKHSDAPAKSFLSWIVKQGGIRDTTGDVSAIMGGGRARPGLINNKNGIPLDILAGRIQEAAPGHFPYMETTGHGAPAVNDVLRMIDDASRGQSGRLNWWLDEGSGLSRNEIEATRWAAAMDEVLFRAGIDVGEDLKNTRDVAKLIRDGWGERRGGNVTLADLDKIAADMEAAGEFIPASIRVKSAEMDLDELREGLAAVRSTLARARADKARQTQNLRVADARTGEAEYAARQSRGRIGLIEDQLSRADLKRELLGDALAIANRLSDDLRTKIETELGAWEGKSVSEVKSALRAREKYAQARNRAADAPRLRAADSAVDRAVRSILDSNRALDDLELKARAEQITDRVLSSPDGRLPYDIHEGGPDVGWKGSGEPPRGPLARRDFAIPDDEIREFLEDDVETVVGAYLRTIVPDLMLTERFGDVRMTEAFRKLHEDYQALANAAKSDKERTRLHKERDTAIRDLAAIRDRVRGVYGFTDDALMRNAARYASAAKNFNVLTTMGVAGQNSIPDAAGVVLRHGLATAFRDGWMPFFQHLSSIGKEGDSGWKQAARQYRAMGIASEVTLNSRRNALHDISETYQPQSRLERTLHHGADMMMIANLQSPFTDWAKTVASIVSGNEIFRAAKAVTDGNATKKQLAALAESNIDAATARKIWEQFQTGGEIVDGVHLPNTADWADDAARQAFEGAVAREADIMVVTPGQEKSLWLSNPVLGVIGQFKSFIASATDRILIANLQRSDAATLQGLVFSVGLGMLTYKLNSLTGGVATSERPQDWIKEGISRSGVMGWFEEGNAMASKATGGAADIFRLIGADRPTSRFLSRNKLDAFLGPTAGKINNILQLSHAAGTADWSASDTRALRQLVAGQNLIWFRGVLNQVERSANDALGVENLQAR